VKLAAGGGAVFLRVGFSAFVSSLSRGRLTGKGVTSSEDATKRFFETDLDEKRKIEIASGVRVSR
jgi:hypothetical protein